MDTKTLLILYRYTFGTENSSTLGQRMDKKASLFCSILELNVHIACGTQKLHRFTFDEFVYPVTFYLAFNRLGFDLLLVSLGAKESPTPLDKPVPYNSTRGELDG